jgi:hypothetical protein
VSRVNMLQDPVALIRWSSLGGDTSCPVRRLGVCYVVMHYGSFFYMFRYYKIITRYIMYAVAVLYCFLFSLFQNVDKTWLELGSNCC